MLNLKKGLAVVMAAATALTFAPLAQLGAPVKAEASTAKTTVKIYKTTDGDKAEQTSIDLSSTGSADKSLSYDVDKAEANETISVNSSDDTIATVSTTKTTAGADGTLTGGDLTITPKKVGAAEIRVIVGDKRATLTVNVLGTKSASDLSLANTSAIAATGLSSTKIGEAVITGENFGETTNTPTLTSATVAAKAGATNKGAAPTISYGSAKVSDKGTKATFDINANTNGTTVGDKWTVSVSTSETTPAQTKTFDIEIVSKADSKLTYGGVLKDIYAYKGASYDLAEHATVKFQKQGGSAYVNYSGSELTWYLVDKDNIPTVGEQRDTIKYLTLPASTGNIEQGKAGSLKVTVADPANFATALTGSHIVAEALVDGVRTVVYVEALSNVTPITDNVAVIPTTINETVVANGKAGEDKELKVLDKQIANPTQDNKWLEASQVTYPAGSNAAYMTDTNYTLTVKRASGSDNPFKGSFLAASHTGDLSAGNYYETAYIPFKVNNDTSNTVYIQKVELTIAVNTGVKFRVKDGSSILATNYDEKTAEDPTVYLNLADTKTWNIKDHTETDAGDPSKVSYAYRSDSANVDVDSNGVLTAKSVGNAFIYIKATYNGLTTPEVKLQVRVNQYGFDTVTVKGQDGDEARVLNPRDYNNNSIANVTSEEKLVTKQIPYVQIEITGSETTNVIETPVATSANGAKLTYSFVKNYDTNGLTINPATGKITIDYTKCTDDYISGNVHYLPTVLRSGNVYGVKVVSAETSKSAATTSYFYVVVDYPDQKISGLEDNYTVGACSNNTTTHVTNDEVDAVKLYEESGESAKNFREVSKTTDDFNGTPYYKDDNTSAFSTTFTETASDPTGVIKKAYSDKQTMHVLAYNAQSADKKLGYTAKLITVKSAPAVENKVTKITNKDTGAVIYDDTKDAAETATHISINDITHIQVTLAYPVATSGSAVTLAIAEKHTDNNSVINQEHYVTAVKNKNNVDITLYPNTKGTTVIMVGPSGSLTKTDRTDIHKTPVLLAIEYDGTNPSKQPAKVTGLKVSNKKGANVSVSWTSQGKNINYRVYKKVGNGKWIAKNVAGSKTSLKVKKGAKVQVKVKAYVKNAEGKTTWGPKATKKTFKTDKK